MGWFWADSIPQRLSVQAPHPVSKTNTSPPPECPMHKPNDSSSLKPPKNAAAPNPASSIPTTSDVAVSYPPQTSWSSRLNPLNYMPSFRNERPSNSPQSISLPLQREMSTIPRGDSEENWEYPSPQQMYNAMLRKGYTDTPAEDVEAMVAVHNFLNEGAWNEIEEWERIFGKGLAEGWEKCRRGEQGLMEAKVRREFMAAMQAERRKAAGLPEEISNKDEGSQPRLLRFQGRPGDPTPKAKMLQYLAWAFPERFGTEPPFDRHDWYVARRNPDGSVKEVRYVIDYYGGGLQATGEPVFYLDIRPALDTPTAAIERAIRWGGDVWWRASGASVREQQQKE